MQDYNAKNDEKVYDSVFWTAANTLKSYLPMLVNEAFGEHFTKHATVTLRSNKEVVELEDGTLARRDVDSLFNLSEMLDEYVEKNYHFECEVKGRRSIAIRIAEYAAGYAFNSASQTKTGAEIEIPHSAVIFLRHDSADIDGLTITVRYPGGATQYRVPVIKIKDYSLDEIFEKKLLLLLPFYVFIFSDAEYAGMNKEADSIKKLEKLLTDTSYRLEQMVQEGELESWQKGNLLRYIGIVLDKLTTKYETVRKGVEKAMGGIIFKTDFDIAHEKGVEEGLETGSKNTLIAAIKNVMTSFGATLEEAMRGLKIPEEEWGMYSDLVKKG